MSHFNPNQHFDVENWRDQQIAQRTKDALAARDAAFAEKHAETPLRELAQYLVRCARTLRHSPAPCEVDAMSGLANLSDVMLVFACGLMAAVILNWNVDLSKTRVEILQREQMQELDNAEEMEQDIQSSSSFEQKGTVYEDPETGKLYVVMPKSSN